jgi:DNA-binding CsgD family transcriptional regulator
VFIQNCREYTILNTAHFGPVAQIEVGALLVGRISNNQEAGSFRRGEEKGKFLYGGSTVVLLLPPGAAEIEGRFWQATARGEEIDRILGLEMGADDYIVKPFSPREVISRIKAVLRRTAPQAENAHAPQQELTTLHFGSLEIQPERYSVRIGGAPVNLTPREVDVLTLLASNPGRVFDRDQILSRVWGYDFFGDTRTVDTHIKRLRQKIDCEEMGKKWDIVTVYGKGYKFEVLE